MIRMTIRRRIGLHDVSFTVEGKSLFDVVLQSQQIGFSDVPRCGRCNSESLHFKAYAKTKEVPYDYLKLRCGNIPTCGAQVTFGVTKEDGAYFLRKDPATHKVLWELPKRNGAAAPAEPTEA